MNSAPVLSAFEAETLVQNLRRFDLKDYGSKSWLKQHETLEKLNIQAHQNVHLQNEEFVTETFILFKKMEDLIWDLLVSETWVNNVFKLVLAQGAQVAEKHHLKIYLMLYHEATVLNLLEVMLFKKEACEALNDSVIDLIDYCSRKLAVLNSWEHPNNEETKLNGDAKTKTYLLDKSEVENLQEQSQNLLFTTSITSLSILRYLTDHILHIPLAAITRILNTNDMLSSLAVLLQRAPWFKQSRHKDCVSRFEGIEWVDIKREDAEQVGKVEGQVWLAMYNLMCEPECRRKYEYDERRQETVLKVRTFLTDTVKDQIPPLVHLHRSLEELSLLTPSTDPYLHRHGKLVELIPSMLPNIVQKDYTQIAQHQLKTIFTSTSAMEDTKALAQSMASTYDLSVLDELLSDPKCSNCGMDASNRCSRCKGEWYCGRKCQVEAWSKHKGICDMLAKSA